MGRGAELVYPRSWQHVTLEDFMTRIHAYIRWYNERRITVSLGGRGPIEYRHAVGLMSVLTVHEIVRTPSGSDFNRRWQQRSKSKLREPSSVFGIDQIAFEAMARLEALQNLKSLPHDILDHVASQIREFNSRSDDDINGAGDPLFYGGSSDETVFAEIRATAKKS